MDLERVITSKLLARISIFGIHIAAFGAGYNLISSSTGLSIAMVVLSIVCLRAENVLSEHYSQLFDSVKDAPALKPGLRGALKLWYWFAILFWISNVGILAYRGPK